MALEPPPEPLSLSLIELLGNALILRHTSSYVGVNGLMSLSATSKKFRNLIFETPHVFQRIDLSDNKSCISTVQKGDKRNEKLIASMLETQSVDGGAMECTLEEHLARPLDSILGHLTHLDLLKDVRTLILDGLAVPGLFLSALLCGEIKNDIRLLSLRGVEELNEESLARCLRYLIRSSRPKNEPKLKGLYYFTPVNNTTQKSNAVQTATSATIIAGVMNSAGAQLGSGLMGQDSMAQFDIDAMQGSDNTWYNTLGEVRMKESNQLWGDLLEACEGLIAFDATICRHDRGTYDDPRPKVANIRLSGCQSCRSSPEGGTFSMASKLGSDISQTCHLKIY